MNQDNHKGDVEYWAQRIRDKWREMQVSIAEAKRLKKRRPGKEETQVEAPLAQKLLEQFGPNVRRQVICPTGRVDIVTDEMIIECKARGDAQSLFDAARQLKRYAPHFKGYELWIAVPIILDDARWLQKAFGAVEIKILQMDLEP